MESDLSLAILGLLAVAPMSGYSLRKVFLTTALKAFSGSPGAIYPALRRLESEGLVEGTVEQKDTLRPRKVFGLTRRGREVLADSLSRPVGRKDVIWGMDRLLLRFSFMSGLLSRERTLEFLNALASHTEDYLKELEAEYKTMGSGRSSFTGRAALEQGVESYRTTARWARKTLDALKKRASL
ncbi:MAG: helix-turn-helix transcriptional regulator [Candidatus Aminicenantes bacterium]|nr:helix-turn-helix transcriptional regulator [Candidatus Aminicenantes bacterium]